MGILLKSQKASLYEILKANRFETGDFDIEPYVSQEGAEGERVILKGSEYFFAIFPNSLNRGGGFYVVYSPGEQMIREDIACPTWDVVMHFFNVNLFYLKREMTTMDPWEETKKFAKGVRELGSAGKSNKAVSEVEREAIWKALGGIQATLLAHVQEDKEKGEYIKHNIQLLKDSASKFGRKDYLNILYTTLIGIAVAVSFPQNMWPSLFCAFWETIKHLQK